MNDMPSYSTLLLYGKLIAGDEEVYQLDGKLYLVQEEWNGVEVGYIVTFLENVP